MSGKCTTMFLRGVWKPAYTEKKHVKLSEDSNWSSGSDRAPLTYEAVKICLQFGHCVKQAELF